MMKDEGNSYLIIFGNGCVSRMNHSGLSRYWKAMYDECADVAQAWPRFPSPSDITGSVLWFLSTPSSTGSQQSWGLIQATKASQAPPCIEPCKLLPE